MAVGNDPVELVGREPDVKLLNAGSPVLPDDVGRPEVEQAAPGRGAIVGAGAAMTGLTLVGGLALIVFGVVEGFAQSDVGAGLVWLVIGLVLVGTHWGWVHVAEATAQARDRRHNRGVLDQRQQWLNSIEPFCRWSVSTAVGDDGSITITTMVHRPVAAGDRTFTFVSEVAASEVHAADEPAAAVAERAELLRREAAARTAAERARYDAAHGAYERAALAAADESERLAAARAASQALSDQINSHLRQPPLTE